MYTRLFKHKIPAAVFFVLVLTCPILAQDSVTQAINPVQVLSQNRDTVHVDFLLKISEEIKTSQPKQAFEYAREALTIAEELNDSYRIGLASRALAGIYTVTAIYDKALEYLLTALTQFKTLGDSVEIAGCYNDLGVVYMSSENYIDAKSYFLQAITLNKKLGNHERIARNYMNLGLCYLKQDSIDKGLSHFMVSLLITDSLKMEPEKIELLNNIGYGYARLGRHEDALKSYYTVLELIGDKPDDFARSQAMINIAQGYYSLKNYPVALKYANDGVALAKSKNFGYLYREASRLLSNIYVAEGNYKLAYQYLNEFSNISDTIRSSERAEQLAKIQTLYELNSKEQENALLLKENIQNKKRMQLRSLVIVLITLLLVVLALVLYLLNRMNNRQIALNKKLAAQSNELETLNDLKDKFFSFVAHNLKNPFNTIMGFAELMQHATETNDKEKVARYSGLIFNLSTQVQKVLSNLLEWSRLQRRSFECKPERLELTNLAKDVLEMNTREAARKDIILSITDLGTIFVWADRTMITTVLQNLVSNAITYTPAGGQISVECTVVNGNAEVSISDTGIGILKENLERLFHFDFTHVKIGHSDNNGAGLGLIICHEMLLKNGGSIYAKSDPGKGSRFTFTLPLANDAKSGAENENTRYGAASTDIMDDLLKQGTDITEPIKSECRLQIIPRFDEVARALSIDNLELLSESILKTGKNNNFIPLTNFGNSLNVLIKSHQIDQIIRILPRFRDYINSVIKTDK